MNTNAELRAAYLACQAGRMVRLDYLGLKMYGHVEGFGSETVTVTFPGAGPTTHKRADIHVALDNTEV